MRPSVNQSLIGINGLIKNNLLATITSEHGKTSTMEIISAVEQIQRRWEKVIPNLMEEDDDLTALFSSLLPVLNELGQKKLVFAELKKDIENQIKKPPASRERYPSYAALEKENDELRALLVRLINAREEMKGIYPDNKIEELAKRTRTHLRKYLDRELEWSLKVYRRA